MSKKFKSLNKITPDTIIDFGKYKGRTLDYLIEFDPEYLIFLDKNNILKIPQELIVRVARNAGYLESIKPEKIDKYIDDLPF
jgi:uncharacterized protein (DUF3820 family)